MAGERKERIARNEAMFRAGNERMAQWEERHAHSEVEEYFCECADLDCREKINLRHDDYERVRQDSMQFVIVPGHEQPEAETVIEKHDHWFVIKKNEEVREMVERTDMRHPYGRKLG
jgi:hypothetical protein